jgi:hypothetical protein
MVNQPVRDPDLYGEITDTLKARQSLQERQNRKETYQFKMKDRNIYKNGCVDEDTNNIESYGGSLRNKSTVTIGSRIRSCWVYILSLISLCTYTQSQSIVPTVTKRPAQTANNDLTEVLQGLVNVVIGSRVVVMSFTRNSDTSLYTTVPGLMIKVAYYETPDMSFTAFASPGSAGGGANVNSVDAFNGFSRVIVGTSKGALLLSITVGGPQATVSQIRYPLSTSVNTVRYIPPTTTGANPTEFVAQDDSTIYRYNFVSTTALSTYVLTAGDKPSSGVPYVVVKGNYVLVMNPDSGQIRWLSTSTLVSAALFQPMTAFNW